MTEQLKRCPFCGGNAEVKDVDDGWNVECCLCGATSKTFVTHKKTIEAWNRRIYEDD